MKGRPLTSLPNVAIRQNNTGSAVICLIVVNAFFALFAVPMGLANMFSTLLSTAFSILTDTCFYIMALAVVMGALSAVLAEFGVVDFLNRLFSPLMKPLYGLPGAAALGIVTTYLSDNPAILSLAEDKSFRRFFAKAQLPVLTNIGTSFGMGLIVTTYMLTCEKAAGTSLFPAVLIGNFGAIVGSIVSSRLMLRHSKQYYGNKANELPDGLIEKEPLSVSKEIPRLSMRIMNSILDGGKNGVQMGLSIIPGVVIICTVVLMLTNDTTTFTGAAYEGIGLIPQAASKIEFLLKPLFGFRSASCVSVPITALGSAGAAIGLVNGLLTSNAANAHDVAVFTAMCMCWSGYLSTHVSMMDSLGCKELTGKAILSHTLGGLAAGLAANWLYQLAVLLFHF